MTEHNVVAGYVLPQLRVEHSSSGLVPRRDSALASRLVSRASRNSSGRTVANLQAALRSQCATAGEQPERFLRSVNQLLYENTAGGDYATLFFAEYDDRTRKLRYSNCGHPPALLLRGDDTVERLAATCTVVGLFEKWDCTMEELELAPGDAVLLYTDGVTEAMNGEGEEFGEERLLEAARQNCRLSVPELMVAVADQARRFSPQEQTDDLTLIVAKCA